ncbi:hypothetical protein CROQUDRAFT_664008 [Cronartium quercuum f. sp. fusiforme G11]|uniref:Uncharacterized protein n=1 Tax=Cronartium quercuum f. sp. fusiforme G11 TaxID=708437 RepID=A0A9P6NC66_9BASI|nr:hypothetical protein CROQUDRAFT_664008 [Cronartium quercuum f. sp. fusiforme G11]
MGSFLGISLQVWQTILIIAFPFIYGSLPRIKAIYHRLRRNSPNQNSPTPVTSRLSIKECYQKLGWVRLGLLLILFSTIILRTTYFRPNKSNPFTLTRLPLTTSTVSLTAALARIYRARGLPDTPVEQQRLVQRLTSLDSRMLFTVLGPDSLLNCRWCRPPSKESVHLNDHLLYTIPRLASEYGLALISLGLITSHAPSLDAKRRIWRIRIAASLLTYLIFECIFLSICISLPTLTMDTKHKGRMIGDKLYIIRHLIFSFCFVLSTWSILIEREESNTTALVKLGVQIGSISHSLDNLVSRLRIAALQRSTIMRDEKYRLQSNQFWSYAESQSRVAIKNPGVKSSKEQLGLSYNGNNRLDLKKWIENVYPVPTFGTSS